MKRAVLGLMFVASVAGASSPERYSDGLSARALGNTSDGITVLRAAPSGRILVPGGTFTQGSTAIEMLQGVQLCQREPLGQVLVPISDSHGIIHRRSLHCDVERFEDEAVAHSVTLSPFWIDRTEVRVADYLRCASSGACSAPGFSLGDARFALPDLPVVLVSWTDARDYCAFAKGRLPTEAEWELAARGLTGRTFPWGNVYNPHLANHGSIALDPTDATDGFAGLAPVGSIPDGRTPLGLLDMAGNAAEWVADGVDPDPGGEVPAYAPVAVTNPHHDTGARRVVRGGSYMHGADSQRSAARMMSYESRRTPFVGFRCASDP